MAINFTEIEQQFHNAPAGVKRALSSPEVAEQVIYMCDQFNIEGEKVNLLADEIALLLLGVTHEEKLAGRLRQQLDLPEERAVLLAKEVVSAIITPTNEKTQHSGGPHQSKSEDVLVGAPDLSKTEEHQMNKGTKERAGQSSKDAGGAERQSTSTTPLVGTPRYTDDAASEAQRQEDKKDDQPQEKQQPHGSDPYREPVD